MVEMRPASLPALRVGIDVGGTFTDVVAVEAGTRRIVARVKVPTTHASAGGVADGIIDGLRRALALPGVAADRIAFIAHSTTQATNALLEGDVAPVGIVGLHGPFGWLERRHLRVPPIRLGPSAMLSPRIAFARADDEQALRRAVEVLLAGGAQAIVASEAFASISRHAKRRPSRTRVNAAVPRRPATKSRRPTDCARAREPRSSTLRSCRACSAPRSRPRAPSRRRASALH